MNPTSLQVSVQQFAAGNLSPPELFNALLSSTVVVLATSPSLQFDGLAKVANGEGTPLLPIFTSVESSETFAVNSHPHRVSIAFEALLADLPDHVGVVIDPIESAVEIGLSGISRMKEADRALPAPQSMAQLFSEDDGPISRPDRPWWKFW